MKNKNLISLFALDGYFLLLEGEDTRCEEQKSKEGNSRQEQ